MRVLLTAAAAGSITLCALVGVAPLRGQTASEPGEATSFDQRKTEYLKRLLPSVEKVRNYIGEGESRAEGYHPNAGWTFHPELGWVVEDTIRHDGINGSRAFYRYEPTGARKRINFADAVARIHTYGDSFTHCDQVNDGETWQEYLATHLGEPIENFGVGGYSVYQAFRRMKLVEETHPAEYVVLNIYDDDHYRNLDSWRNIRLPTAREGPLPHVRVNVEKNEVVEVDNLCPTTQDVHKLRDLDWVVETFGDDPGLLIAVLGEVEGRIPAQAVSEVAAKFGVPYPAGGRAMVDPEELREVHTRAALFSTIKILGMVERYINETGKKLFVILSYSAGGVRPRLLGEDRFDQVLIDYLKTRPYPWVDLREAHRAEFKTFNLDADAYLKRYYIGHYGPAGNFFCAWALKNKLVEWLDPKPKAYRDRD